MNPFNLNPANMNPTSLNRRRLLKTLAIGSAGAGAAAAGLLPGCTADPTPAGTGPGGSNSGGTSRPASPADRILVVIEMAGGNDGLSTVVPVENGRYHDLRPTLALDGEDIATWQPDWALHAALAGLGERGVAAVTGVGSSAADLSHFEMQARWWAGSPRGTPLDRTGFLGRLCDELHGDEELTGITIGQGMTPALLSNQAPTTGFSGEGLGLLQGDDDTARAVRRMLERVTGVGEAGAGIAAMLRIVDMIDRLPEPSTDYPDTQFGHQMALAAQVIRADEGVRVIHVPMAGGNFDTHDDHRSAHQQSMELFGAGVEAFLDELDDGQRNRVLVATTSEFGRRPEEHRGGLDHGTASTLLLAGPVHEGLHGEPSSLTKFDADGNFVPTVDFDRYLATFAQWFDVDPGAVLAADRTGSAPQPIPGVLA